MLLIGHGSAGGSPDCNSCRSCGPQCRDIDDVDAYFDVEGCWFDSVELEYPSETCGVTAILHPSGQELYAGVRRRRSNPREGFAFSTSRIYCEATSADGGTVTDIVCSDECPMPGDDRSCTGTLRLRDAPLGEPLGSDEIAMCPMPDGGMPDLGMPDASVPDAASDAPVDAMTDAEADAEADAEVDAMTDAETDAADLLDADLDAGTDADVDAG